MPFSFSFVLAQLLHWVLFPIYGVRACRGCCSVAELLRGDSLSWVIAIGLCVRDLTAFFLVLYQTPLFAAASASGAAGFFFLFLVDGSVVFFSVAVCFHSCPISCVSFHIAGCFFSWCWFFCV